ncbi:HipA domain-containing protein [Caballeronia sp. LZ029]|uniref:type II toxin-antitoxin system HipA family toxin n=1 Tax=Caballeronia sp. LZ029 TaxID=3038564 RepID=UPI00285EF13A|nr:HipA domain-containing protein [Caballeronia sp. LZ029]MDR5746774.1 HipA domain-containing protein [Caballeronia sp. LZ029]
MSLTEDGADLVASTFAYDRAYPRRAKAFEIDPVSLSLAGKRRAAELEESPANSLAYFGAIRDATPDAWGRRVIEAKLGASLNGLPESQYLLQAGSDRVGALDVRCDTSAPSLEGDDSWDALPRLAEGASLIERGLPVPPELADISVQGAALGGARPKASVRDEQGTLHLAKFASEGDRVDVPAIEYATLCLAERAGLRVPSARLTRVNDRNVLLVRRFDRYWANPGGATTKGDARFVRGDAGVGETEHRVPFVSGLTRAGCDEMDARSMSYAALGACMQKHCRTLLAYDGLAELYKRMVFNIFVSNNDDQLRNFAFCGTQS